MVTLDDLERERHEARLKLQRDTSALTAAEYQAAYKVGNRETGTLLAHV